MLKKSFLTKPKPENYNCIEDFRRAEEDWSINYQKRLKEIVEHEKNDGIPIHEKSTSAIRRMLEYYGLDHTKAQRSILLARLELFLLGSNVVTKELKRPTYEEIAHVSQPLHKKTKLSFSSEVKKDLLCVPHDIISNYVFQKNVKVSSRVLRWVDLLQCSRTCLYLHEDAIQVLRSDAQYLFGPGSSEMSILLCEKLRRLWMAHSYTKFSTKARSLLSLTTDEMNRIHISYGPQNSLSQTQIWSFCVSVVKYIQTKYGSISGVKEEFERRKRLKLARKNERDHVRNKAPERLMQLSKMLKEKNYPEMFCLTQGNKKLECVNNLSKTLWAMNVIDVGKCSGFVLEAKHRDFKINNHLSFDDLNFLKHLEKDFTKADFFNSSNPTFFNRKSIFLQLSKVMMKCHEESMMFRVPLEKSKILSTLSFMLSNVDFSNSYPAHVFVWTTVGEKPIYLNISDSYYTMYDLRVKVLYQLQKREDIPLKEQRKLVMQYPHNSSTEPVAYSWVFFASYW